MNAGAIAFVIAIFSCMGSFVLSLAEFYAQRRFHRWAFRVGLTVVKLSRAIPSPASVGLPPASTFQADDWQFQASEGDRCYGRFAPSMVQSGTRGGFRLLFRIEWREGIAEATGIVPLSSLLFCIGFPTAFAAGSLARGGELTLTQPVMVLLLIAAIATSLWTERRRADEMLAALEYHLRLRTRAA